MKPKSIRDEKSLSLYFDWKEGRREKMSVRDIIEIVEAAIKLYKKVTSEEQKETLEQIILECIRLLPS